jgi:hypothetical protein
VSEGKSRDHKHGNGTRLAKEQANNMLIEPDWLNMLMDKSENKHDFAAAYLDVSVFSFLLTRIPT